MDVQAELNRGTEGALSLLAEKQSEAAFLDLLEYAAEACLVNPPAFLGEKDASKYDAVTGEDKLVQTLGARSLSTILEMKDGMHQPFHFGDDAPEPKLDENGEPIEFFTINDLHAKPDRFSLEPNNRVLENAERFGQALIDESFAILGKDAPKWVEKLRNAQDTMEELKVIDWLNERILTISDRSRSESSAEDEAAHFYPPFRISPKFIGEYPHLNVQPSCLSASVIATSFFQQAGVPTLHAGVTTPASETGTHLLTNMVASVAGRFAKDPYDASEEQARKLLPLLQAAKEWKERPLAQHGAVYAKLRNGWIQFDGYSNATVELLSEENAHLDGIYGKLNDWKDIVPNLEFSTSALPERGMQLVSPEYAALSYTLDSFDYNEEERAELVTRIDEALKDIPPEAYTTYLFDTCLLPLLDKKYFDKSNEAHANIMGTILEEARNPKKGKDGNFDTRMDRIFDAAVREYLRWDASPEEFIERCQNDAAYRARRADDFMSLPKMMAVLNAQIVAQQSPGIAHLSIDIGKPAMRIGLATLSDFALYDDNPLPAQFWVTHWPGIVSVFENLDTPPVSDTDWILLFNNLLWQQIHPFTSDHNYDKINSFLSAHTEEKNDGNEQEGPERPDREGGGR